MAVAVGRPIRRHRTRVPDLAVIGDRAPRPVLVKVLIAGHVRRDVIGRGEALLGVVARADPFDKGVRGGALDGRGQGVGAADHGSLARLDALFERAADKPRAALEHHDPRRAIRGSGVDVVAAGLQQPYPAARQVDFDAVAFRELAQTQRDPALRQRDLDDLLVELGQVDFGIAGEVDRLTADADLGL